MYINRSRCTYLDRLCCVQTVEYHFFKSPVQTLVTHQRQLSHLLDDKSDPPYVRLTHLTTRVALKNCFKDAAPELGHSKYVT